MSWPNPSEFSNMLQNPEIAFRDPRLKSCAIERDARGQPRARAGAFANVYKGTYQGGGHVAIRVFVTRSEQRRERYAAISDYLKGKTLSSLVHFDYADKGIRLPSGWYPLVTMEWVTGDILFDWVRQQCLSKNSRALRDAAEKWVRLVQELSDAHIAHGDLQHGNVMVTANGTLKLVDYDCMCVPKLVGEPNLEIGVEPYQHPQRNETTRLFPGLDNFSALYIFVVLRALAAAPGLWTSYNERPDDLPYDKLLFRKEDFDAPQQSRLFNELQQSPDPDVRKWSRRLFELTRVPLADVPPLRAVLRDFEHVKVYLQQNLWDEAVAEIDQQGGPPPAEFAATVEQARRRVACRKELDRAIQAGDEVALQRLSASPLLNDYPKAQPALAVARQAPRAIAILGQLESARKAQSWNQFVQIWEANHAILNGRKSAESFRALVEQWRERNRLSDAVLKLVGPPPGDAAQLRQAWTQLQAAGGHPEANTKRADVERLLARHDAFVTFQAVKGAPGEQTDRTLVAAWNELLFAGWPPAESHRLRVEAARQQLAHWKLLADFVQQNPDVTLDSERNIDTLSAKLPPGYQHRLRERVELARRRLQAMEELRRLSTQSAATEAALAQAWQTLAGLQGENMVPAQSRQRFLLAVRRAPLLKKLAGVSLKSPPDQLDRQLLQLWDDDLLGDCAEAAAWKSAYETARRRQKLLDQLGRAVAADDKAAVADLMESPLLEGYRLPPHLDGPAQKAFDSIKRARALMRILDTRERGRFTDEFDCRAIREFADQVQPFQPLLDEWITADLLAGPQLGLDLPLAVKPLVPLPGSNGVVSFKANWRWPSPRFSDKCLLWICRNLPEADGLPGDLPDQARLNTCQRWTVNRKDWESAGGYRVINAKPPWKDAYAVVWAEIDVGFRKFYSEPLVLGRLEF